MLKPAFLYKDKWRAVDGEWWFTREAELCSSGNGDEIVRIVGSNKDEIQFVSVDENDNVIGFIYFQWNQRLRSADNFGMMSYKKGVNLEFVNDLYRVIDLAMNFYKAEKVSWWAYTVNPANRGYEKFIKRYGGNIVAHLHRSNIFRDGTIVDSHSYEILRDDFNFELFNKRMEKIGRYRED